MKQILALLVGMLTIVCSYATPKVTFASYDKQYLVTDNPDAVQARLKSAKQIYVFEAPTSNRVSDWCILGATEYGYAIHIPEIGDFFMVKGVVKPSEKYIGPFVKKFYEYATDEKASYVYYHYQNRAYVIVYIQ